MSGAGLVVGDVLTHLVKCDKFNKGVTVVVEELSVAESTDPTNVGTLKGNRKEYSIVAIKDTPEDVIITCMDDNDIASIEAFHADDYPTSWESPSEGERDYLWDRINQMLNNEILE